MRTARNPNHKSPFAIEGYVDLGWQNGWKSKYKLNDEGKRRFDGYDDQPEYTACREAKHETRDIDNSANLFRGTDNIVICDECKHFWHYDCSD